MRKVLVIDPHKQEIRRAVVNGAQDIHNIIDNWFDVVTFGDKPFHVYVDDEGLFVTDQKYFMVDGYPQPLAGVAVACGAVDAEGDDTDLDMSPEALGAYIRFLSDEEATRWFDDNADRPASSVTTFEASGPRTEVMATYGQFRPTRSDDK